MGLLEITGTDFAAWNLGCNREDRQAAAMTVEEPVYQMKVAWTATPGADSQLASDVRIGAGGKGRYLLVAHMDPLNTFLAPDCVSDPVERITHDPVDSTPASTSVLTRLSATVGMIGSFYFLRDRLMAVIRGSWIRHRRGVKNARTKLSAVNRHSCAIREVTELRSPLIRFF